MFKRTGNPVTPSTSWQQNLWAIWFAEFASIIGFSSVLPILPFYVQKLGVTSPDAVKFWSGMIFSAHAVTMAVMAPIWGSLADRYGRKPMVERAMFGGALVIGLMSLARSAPQLALLRAFQGMLTGTVADTLCQVSVQEGRRKALIVPQGHFWHAHPRHFRDDPFSAFPASSSECTGVIAACGAPLPVAGDRLHHTAPDLATTATSRPTSG